MTVASLKQKLIENLDESFFDTVVVEMLKEMKATNIACQDIALKHIFESKDAEWIEINKADYAHCQKVINAIDVMLNYMGAAD